MRRMDDLKDGFDFGVEGDVGRGDSVDGKFLAGSLGKMEEAADVVILVVAGEEALRFGDGKAKGGQGDGDSEFAGVEAVQADKFAQRHHRSAASGFSAHGVLLSEVYFGEKEKKRT
jgi:hypothetical protein